MKIEYQDDLKEFVNQNDDSASVAYLKKTPYFSTKVRQLQERSRARRANLFNLKNVITRAKVKVLTKNFIQKINYNNIMRIPSPQVFSMIQKQEEQLNLWNYLKLTLQQTDGINLDNIWMAIWSILNLLQLSSMVFMITIAIAFNEMWRNQIFNYMKIAGLFLYFLQIVFNCICQRFESGRKLINLKEIIGFYLHNGFIIDLLCCMAVLFDLLVDSVFTILLSSVVIIKLWSSMKKLDKIQYLYIRTNERQQYYGLIKIFLTNFIIGHFLSISLNLMGNLNQQENWLTKLNISNSPWFIKYVWGYYWGTNIMLTVGFGDISATNYIQAICLIFIETFSCITLAYNINNLGNIISNIRMSDEQKKKKLKMFYKMAEQNNIDSHLNSQITNFIEESYHIKQSFEFQEQQKILQFLPKDLQIDYISQANHTLFDNIGFLNNLSPKILNILSQNVIRKIAHPDQFYKKKGQMHNFSIIQKGGLGNYFKRNNSILNGTLIQKVTVDKHQRPKIFSLQFVKGKRYHFDVKSIDYSIIYYLELQDFIKCLKELELDYQLFCMMRDRDESVLNENEVHLCDICKTISHSKYRCNKIHFIPLQQHVIIGYLSKKKHCERIDFMRDSKKSRNNKLLVRYLSLKRHLQQFISNRFSPQYFDQIEKMRKYMENMKKLRTFDTHKRQRSKQNYNQLFEQRTGGSLMCVFAPDLVDHCLRQTNDGKVFQSFWNVQLDVVYNFKYYCTGNNAGNINYEKGLRSSTHFYKILSI